MKNKNIIYGLLLVFGLLFIDLLSKYLMQINFEVGESKTIIEGFFSLTYAHNFGAAFSILTGNRIFLVAVSLVGTILFSYYFKDVDFKNKKIFSISISMMLAGTIGNLFDRLFLGYVRDMFDFIIFGYDFAIFNVADMCLVIGIIIFVALTIFEEVKKVKE